MRVAKRKNIHLTRFGEKPECPEGFRTVIRGYYKRIIPKKLPVKCPICKKKLDLEGKKYMILCTGCNTNLWIADLLTKDPKECGVTW